MRKKSIVAVIALLLLLSPCLPMVSVQSSQAVSPAATIDTLRIVNRALLGSMAVVTYANAVIADSPIAWYKLNESNGATNFDDAIGALDLAGNGSYTAGSTALLSNLADTSVDFIAGRLARSSAITTGAGYTIEAMIAPDTLGNETIAAAGSFGTSNYHSFRLRASGFRYTYGNGSSVLDADLGGIITTGRSTHIVLAHHYANRTIKLYLNGKFITSATTSVTVPALSSASFNVGRESDNTLSFDGKIAQVAVYGAELSAARVRAHFLAARAADDAQTSWYAGTSGTYNASGSYSNPVDLQTLISDGFVQAGESAVLKVGDHVGTYISSIAGTALAPVTITCEREGVYPNPCRVKANTEGNVGSPNVATFKVTGDYTRVRDIEFFMEPVNRQATDNLSDPLNLSNTSGLEFIGTGQKIINCTIHDFIKNALTAFDNAIDFEVYGLFSYNNGWTQLDGDGAGGAVYIHNTAGSVKNISNSVFSNNRHWSIQVNGLSGIENINLEDIFAIRSTVGITGNGDKTDISLNRIESHGGGLFGFGDELNGTGSVTNSTYYGPVPLSIKTWDFLNITDNNFIQSATTSPISGYNRRNGMPRANYVFDRNKYWRGITGWIFGSQPLFVEYDEDGLNPTTFTFSTWKSTGGFDLNSTVYDQVSQASATRPDSTFTPYLKVRAVANTYQAGMATIHWWNWGAAGTPASAVDVDLSTAGLTNGRSYSIINRVSGVVVHSFTYNSSSPTVSVPTTDTTRYLLFGDAASTPASVMPIYGVLLVQENTTPRGAMAGKATISGKTRIN